MCFILLIDKCDNVNILSPFQSRALVASIPKSPKKDFKEVFLDANPNGEKIHVI